MQQYMFSIYDSKAKVFTQPYYSTNEQTVIREARKIFNDPQNPMAQNPEDYSIFHLGFYIDTDGSFELLDTPQHLVNLLGLTDNPESME